MPKISAVIISYNEEKYIGQCIDSLKPVADEILVVDSLSTDRTKEICLSKGARVIDQPFLGYKEQKNFAMGHATYDYILSLDADEALSEQLSASIQQVKDNWKYDAYRFNRLNNYCGKWIKNTDMYPETKTRLFNRKKGHWGGVNPHDSFKPNSNSIGFLEGDLLHWLYDSVAEHEEKINKFSSISAQEYSSMGIRSSIAKIWIKSTWRFFHSYILKTGFLEGTTGYIISKNLAHGTFLKYAKLHEMNRNQKNL
ncbi:MAG: glycosyltransferase family 2 protein [Cyclobacteriaceae bacterium]|nr:glycosyltransferase family 2 protein [Cyclobacteriaceae bacterium]